jgi:hypothetical protein
LNKQKKYKLKNNYTKDECLEYVKAIHIGFKNYEYEMAIEIASWKRNFKNNNQYYSESEKQLYFERQSKYQGAMIVYTQRLLFNGIIEIQTGKTMSIPVKNVYITYHDKFLKEVEYFLEKRYNSRQRINNYL